MIDPYRVLELPIDASSKDVHGAYRRLARRYHPDRNPSPSARARMADLNEAYSWLKDGSRRAKYDRRFVVREPEAFQHVVIDAALEWIRSCSVPLESDATGMLILDPSGEPIGIETVGVLGNFEFDRITAGVARRQAMANPARGLTHMVVLTYRVVASKGFLSRRPAGYPPGGVIDLSRSEWLGTGGPVPCPDVLGPFVAG